MARWSRRWSCAVICGALLVPLFAGGAEATEEDFNPCLRAEVHGQAGEEYLDLTYRVELRNAAGQTARAVLLRDFGLLQSVTPSDAALLLRRSNGRLLASVPPGWRGEVTVRAKRRIITDEEFGFRRCDVPLPPAVARRLELVLPGEGLHLHAHGAAAVEELEISGCRTRFLVLPGAADTVSLRWQDEPFGPSIGPWTLEEEHHVNLRPPEFMDSVVLRFTPRQGRLGTLSARIPERLLTTIGGPSPHAPWQIRDGTLQIRCPHPYRRLFVTLQLEGSMEEAEEGGHVLRVPLLGSEEASRWQGRVRVVGPAGALTFTELTGARQVPTQQGRPRGAGAGARGPDARSLPGTGRGERLACTFQGAGAKVVVRAVPVEARRHAVVQSRYHLTEWGVEGTHRAFLSEGDRKSAGMRLTLPSGHLVRAVSGPAVSDWSQEGSSLRVELSGTPGPESPLTVRTDCLTRGRRLRLRPPVVSGATSGDYAMSISHEPGLQVSPVETGESRRIEPAELPEWLRSPEPAVAYRYRDTAQPVELEVQPVRAEVRGSIQEHVKVLPEHIRRDALFLLDVRRRAVESFQLELPEGLTLESVEGPAVEGWGIGEDSFRAVVRLVRPVRGNLHFRAVTRRPVGPDHLMLRGIRLAAAPQLQGWLGIGTDLAVRVRPLGDGRMNLASARPDRAPDYLQGFDNRLLYRFYSGDWELELSKQAVPTVYSAQVLNALRFQPTRMEGTAVLKVTIEQGGLGALRLRLPPGASAPRLRVPDALETRWRDNVGVVQFSGRKTGEFICRVNYVVPTGLGETSVEARPVEVEGARSQSGVLLLLQGAPEVGVEPSAPPAALSGVEAREKYPEWSWRRAHPAVAAYAYRETGWSQRVTVSAHALSERILRAMVPMAKLDTLLQDNRETLNHLRLFVSNRNRQFLTVDLAEVDPRARLIGTYVYGEPVKPFREGRTKLQIPLLTSEKAARVGMSVLDITYAAPEGELVTLGARSMGLPDVDLNVGRVEWTLRLPRRFRIAGVSGNVEEPVSKPSAVPGLARRLLEWAEDYTAFLILAGLLAVCVPAVVILVRFLARRVVLGKFSWRRIAAGVVVLVVIVVLASLLTPAGNQARLKARIDTDRHRLHNVGVALAMYREGHAGAYPSDLRTLVRENYLEDSEVLQSSHGEDVKLVYTPPGPGAAPHEVVAYFLRPHQGADLLYHDNAVRWVELTEDGRLVNPRSGTLITRAGRVERRGFAGEKVGSRELSQAFSQQMAQQAPSDEAPQPEQVQERVDRALIEANREEIREAAEQYREAHGGRAPERGGDLAPYLEDSRLRAALRRYGEFPALAEARQKARAPSEKSNLYEVGRAIQEYRDAHAGDYPPDLQRLLEEGYLADADVLESPAGPEVELVYTPPGKDAQPGEAVAYFLHPGEGANIATVDGAVRWSGWMSGGRPVNPRTKERLATGKVAEVMDRRQLARARLSLGRSYMRRGQYEKAERQFRRALENVEGYAAAEQQLQRLKALRKATGEKKGAGAREVGRDLEQVEQQIAQMEDTLTKEERPRAKARRPVRPAEAPEEKAPALKVPPKRASIVRRAGGGRSVGALPIQIDFPAPESVSYRFVKPFVGRAKARLGFRLIHRTASLWAELLLAVAALAGFLFVRRRSRSAGVSFAGGTFVVALAIVLAAPPLVASLAGATALAMGICLAAETLSHAWGYAFRPRPLEEEAPDAGMEE